MIHLFHVYVIPSMLRIPFIAQHVLAGRPWSELPVEPRWVARGRNFQYEGYFVLRRVSCMAEVCGKSAFVSTWWRLYVACPVVLFCVVTLVYAGRAYAEDVKQEEQLWYQFNIDQSAGKWIGHVDINPRFGRVNNSVIAQFMVRPAVGYRFAKEMAGWLGYVWAPTWVPLDDNSSRVIHEQRLWEQWTWNIPILGGVASRTRLEQRYRSGADGDGLGWRVRQQLRATVPLLHDQRLYLLLWDEIFFNLNNATNEAGVPWQKAGFDQNRAGVGIGVFTDQSRAHRFETGYMNNFVRSASGNADTMRHVWLTTLSLNFE
jgi:hypothetical protein